MAKGSSPLMLAWVQLSTALAAMSASTTTGFLLHGQSGTRFTDTQDTAGRPCRSPTAWSCITFYLPLRCRTEMPRPILATARDWASSVWAGCQESEARR